VDEILELRAQLADKEGSLLKKIGQLARKK
jgi:hypothetical protein